MNKVKQNSLLMAFVIITTAISLRAPITSVGSILYCIAEDLNLSNTVAGAITTIPLVVMASLSPFVGRIGERLGLNRALLLGVVILLVGILLRSFAGFSGLLVGTALIGAGIAFGNVLITALIKTFFPNSIGTMTGVFTTTMTICSGIGAGISVPIAVGLGWGWQLTFCIWAITAVVAICVNLVQIKRLPTVEAGESIKKTREKRKSLFKIPLAWCIVLLFGSQSCVFFMMATWLPTILVDKGISAVSAGMVATVFQVAAIPANFGIPIFAGRIKDQRVLTASVPLLAVVGLVGVMLTNNVSILAVCAGLMSLGLGGTFSLSLVLVALRTKNGEEAASVAGFSQSAGYFMAAIGPTFAGMLYDYSQNWAWPIAVAIIIMIIGSVSGIVAGADKQIYQ